MFSKIFNKKVLLTLVVLFIGLMMVSVGAGVYAGSVATTATTTAATSAVASGTTSSSGTQPTGCGSSSWVFGGMLILFFGGMMVLNYFKKKKAVEQNAEKMERLVAGTKIKTIGLIEGEIVEVFDDSLLIQSGTSTLKIDKRAVWQIIPEPQPVEEVEQEIEQEPNQEPFAEEFTDSQEQTQEDKQEDIQE